MKIWLPPVFGLFLAHLLLTAESAPALPGLEAIMPAADYAAAGLDKLSPAEREALRDWMERYLAGERKQAAAVAKEEAIAEVMPKGDDAFGVEDIRDRVVAFLEPRQPERIGSRILGEFTGWTGKTVFRLENGQVWRQAERDEFYYPGDKTAALAVIEKGMMGAYYLKIDGYGSRVKVRRVQ